MTHLLEPTHNSRFIALMDLFMPTWRGHREMLNRLPVRHESWEYERLARNSALKLRDDTRGLTVVNVSTY